MSPLTSRRALLGGGAVAVAIPADAVLPSPHPDYDLTRLCARFDELEAKWQAVYKIPNPSIDETERDIQGGMIREVQKPLLQRIVAIRATTFEGLMAFAGVLS